MTQPEPTENKLNPVIECFRCGYWADNPDAPNGYVIFNPPNDNNGTLSNIMRYGPSFASNFDYNSSMKAEDIDGLPIKCCCVECCLDTLSSIYETDDESFTICCIILSKTYQVRIPGLDLSIDGPQVRIDRLNRDPMLLERWGGTQTYEHYRSGVVMPSFDIKAPVSLEDDVEDEFAIMAQDEYINDYDSGEESGELPFISSHLRKQIV